MNKIKPWATLDFEIIVTMNLHRRMKTGCICACVVASCHGKLAGVLFCSIQQHGVAFEVIQVILSDSKYISLHAYCLSLSLKQRADEWLHS